jgi:hypothetical protein
MGCTNCGGKVGCDHRKTAMMGEVERALEQLYPSRTWGEAQDLESTPATDVQGLADDIAAELAAATFVKYGDETEPCDYIYVLCMGRTPCAVQVRDHGVAVPDEWRGAERLHELYLRVVIAHRTRMAAVQQVAITVDGAAVHESPRAGVYDAPLLPRMQKLVAVLAARDLLHVDFGEIAHAPHGFHPGAWRELYGADPSIANYLFYPQPTTMITTTLLDGAA